MTIQERHRVPAAFWLLLLAGTALRFVAVDKQSLWWDEAWQFEVSSAHSLGELFTRHQNARISLNPPLSHIVTWFFLQLGQTDFFLRLPSVMMGSIGVAVTYFAGRRLVGPRAALFAMACTAFAPFHLYYSQEARLYAQLMLLSLGSTWLLARAVTEGRRGTWIAYVATITAAIYTHVYASFGILAHALWVLVFHRRRLLAMVGAGLTAVVAFVPMILFFLKRLTALKEPPGGAGASFANLPYTAVVYAVGLSMGPSVTELKQDRTVEVLKPFLPLAIGIMLLFGTLIVLGLMEARRRDRGQGADRRDAVPGREGALVVLSFILPVLGVFTVSFQPEMTYNVRYTAWAFPAFLLLLGAGFDVVSRRSKWVGMGVGAIVVGLWSVSISNYFTNPRYAKEDVRDAVAYWRTHAPETPLVVYNSWHTAKRYMSESERTHLESIWIRSNTVKRIREIAARDGGVPSVYVLVARDHGHAVEELVRQDFPVLDERTFPGGVKLLHVSSASASRS